MAKILVGQVGAWVKDEAVVECEDTGDATLVLRRVYQQYALKAIKLYKKASGENADRIRETAAYYEQAAVDIQRLIDQGEPDNGTQLTMLTVGERETANETL